MIRQWGKLGVATKNGKAITTYPVEIPALMDVVREWDKLVRAKLPSDALWFATLSRDGTKFTGKTRAGATFDDAIRNGLQSLCDKKGLRYLHPHCLRHGHIVYAIKQAKDMQTLTAISQNVGHEYLKTTLTVYGRLASNDVQAAIAQLGEPEPPTIPLDSIDNDTLIKLLQHTLSKKGI